MSVFYCVLMPVLAVAATEKDSADAALNAESPLPPTVQRRFAQKLDSTYIHATLSTHLRNDFYNAFGAGFDVGWYPTEDLGIELRFVDLSSHLNDTARRIKRDTGLVPDARPQNFWLASGVRYSLGYGKVLLLESLLVHFDPQLTTHVGVARADTRWLPSVWFGASILAHFRYGLQARIDLAMAMQFEKRTHGWMGSFGLTPMLSVGWTPNVLFGEAR